MRENKWDNLKQNHNAVINKVLKYDKKISNGEYLEINKPLYITYYYDFLTAHIISLLIDNKNFYIPKFLVDDINCCKSNLMDWVEWDISNDNYYIKYTKNTQNLISQMVEYCFDENRKDFIQEICAQDIIGDESLAKDISSVLSDITTALDLEINGEEELFRRLSELREKGKPMFITTKIQNKYNFEYSNRGALVRNRVFKHTHIEKANNPNFSFASKSDLVLDYRLCKNICQSAILHIEANGSTGTGFLISEDGYVLTCAHVVENSTEIYASVICGDGYKSVSGREGVEVYDVSYGEVVYLNKTFDIALIKMEGYHDCSFLPLETSCLLSDIGDEVVTFGYPLGYELPKTNLFGPNISFYKGYISSNQIHDGNSVAFLDIDVKSGNSGSPVISLKTGKVIGIISGAKVGGNLLLKEKMPYMIPIQHFIELSKQYEN